MLDINKIRSDFPILNLRHVIAVSDDFFDRVFFTDSFKINDSGSQFCPTVSEKVTPMEDRNILEMVFLVWVLSRQEVAVYFAIDGVQVYIVGSEQVAEIVDEILFVGGKSWCVGAVFLGKGTQFDPDFLPVFLALLDEGKLDEAGKELKA